MTRELSRRRLLAAGGVLAGGATVAQFGYVNAAGGATTGGAGPADAAAGSKGGEAGVAWQSELVRVDANGRLAYTVDDQGNRIPDFGYAGYRNGAEPIPDVAAAVEVEPVSGDNTAQIQAAIDEVGSRPPGDDGFRGAVVLAAGTYEIKGTLLLRHSGVVLRGAGDDEDPAQNTILRATGNTPEHRPVVVVGGGGGTKWAGQVAGTRTDITTDWVKVGESTFEVADAGGLKVGANIIVFHPCTEAWLASVDYGATGADEPWQVDEQPILYNRYITAVEANTVTIDVPVFEHLRRDRSQAYVYEWDRAGLVTQVGVENLRVEIAYAGDPDQDEDHAWIGIHTRQVEDAWVRNCTILHFAHGGVETLEATRLTVRDCRALDPVSTVDGGRRYNFDTEGYSQQILFENCRASKARHAFISNGTSTASGVAFVDGTSEGSLAASEGHRRWSQGLLWDNIEESGPKTSITLGIYNRGDYGTGHGWAVSHSVGWNCDMAGKKLVVQRPPTSQNYAIGCSGEITGAGPFDHPAGHIEGANQSGLEPASLYRAQLADRG